MVADVAEFQREVFRNCVLDVYRPISNIRSGDIGVHREDGTVGGDAIEIAKGKDWTVVVLGSGGKQVDIGDGDRAVPRQYLGTAGGGNAAQAKRIVEREERFPVYRLINDSTSGANYEIPIARGIPRQSYPWGEILMVTVIGGTDLMADLYVS